MNATAPATIAAAAIGLSAGPGDVPPPPRRARTGPPVGPAVAALMRRGLDRHEAGLVAQRDREAAVRAGLVARFRVRVAAELQALRDYLAAVACRGRPGTGLPAEIARLDGWLNRHRETL